MNLFFIKEFFGISALVLTFIAFLPYIISILRNRSKPHLFSWIVWFIATATIGVAQICNNGGHGAISIFISGILSGVIMCLAYIKKTDDSIKRVDYIFLYLSGFALLLWFLISDALYTVIILVTIDVFATMPTIRKAYDKPFEEYIPIFAIMAFRNLCSFLALDSYNTITTSFQIATGVMSISIVVVIIIRRRVCE